MAIEIKKDPNQADKIEVDLDNGHAETLKKIVKDYGLISEKEAIGFMLAVFGQAEGKQINVEGKIFVPSQSIKKQADGNPENQQV